VAEAVAGGSGRRGEGGGGGGGGGGGCGGGVGGWLRICINVYIAYGILFIFDSITIKPYMASMYMY